jgi:hypothetical protein
MIAAPPSPSDRLLGASYYLGLAPLTRFWGSRPSSLFLQHQYTQAMAAFFFLLMLFLADCLFESGECFVLVQFPRLEQPLVARFGSFLPISGSHLVAGDRGLAGTLGYAARTGSCWLHVAGAGAETIITEALARSDLLLRQFNTVDSGSRLLLFSQHGRRH